MTKFIKKYIKNHKEKGGEYIGQGAYGCVFDHQIKCKNINIISKIPEIIYSKVFDSNEEGESEWENAKIIATIDPEYNSFIYSFAKCQTTYDELKKDKSIDKCKLEFTEDIITILKMPFGGIDYKKYIDTYNPSFNNFIYSIIPLFEGLVKLKTINKVHQDIKPDNILYDPKRKIWRFIDFGLLSNTNSIYTKDNLYIINGDYYPEPTEYRILSAIYKFKNTTIDSKNIIQNEDNIYNIKLSSDSDLSYGELIKTYLSKSEYEIELNNFLKYLQHFSLQNIVQELNKYTSKIDIYSLGLVLIFLTLKVKIIHDIEYEKKYKKYMDMIKMMIIPDPRKRLSPEEALQTVKSI
jgi:serine/threonine protein kinase